MKMIYTLLFTLIAFVSDAQTPCKKDAVYRQFDFWIGEWEAFNTKNKKAGDSKISVILDSCVMLEEWTSTSVVSGVTYTGKSFNTYNASSGQWQQTWVDNVGGTTEYLAGKLEGNKMLFSTKPFAFSKDTMAIRTLNFVNIGPDKVRQYGEITKDNGKTWAIEFDLEYRRKKKL
jgi:hypothetical protein